MFIFTFPLWIRGACGRMGFKQACDMIRVVFCASTVLKDRLERNKTLMRKTLVTFGYVKLKVSNWVSSRGEGQADSLGAHFNFIIDAGEGLVMMQGDTGARRRASSGAPERVEEEWQEKSGGPARTALRQGEEGVWGMEGRGGKGVKWYGDTVGRWEMSLWDVTMVNDVCCFCHSLFH